MEWQPINTAPKDGTIIRVRLRDPLGYYELQGDCFLHDDGRFILIDPPRELSRTPTHWKPAV